MLRERPCAGPQWEPWLNVNLADVHCVRLSEHLTSLDCFLLTYHMGIITSTYDVGGSSNLSETVNVEMI
jgi:hypothetical protein